MDGCKGLYRSAEEDLNGGTVMKVALVGGIPTTLASGSSPFGIAVDSTSVYWINANGGTVMKRTPK